MSRWHLPAARRHRPQRRVVLAVEPLEQRWALAGTSVVPLSVLQPQGAGAVFTVERGRTLVASLVSPVTPFLPSFNAPPTMDSQGSTPFLPPLNSPPAATQPPPGGGMADQPQFSPPARPTVRLVSGPANGTIQLTPNGRATYRPRRGFVGTDQFTYALAVPGSPDQVRTALLQVTPTPEPPRPDELERHVPE